jgi:hypothetical protein
MERFRSIRIKEMKAVVGIVDNKTSEAGRMGNSWAFGIRAVRNSLGLNLTIYQRNRNEHAMTAKMTPAMSAVRPAASA